MYDKEYAELRIQHHESGKDIYRKQYLEPYLKDALLKILGAKSVLDVGCGWGLALDFLDDKCYYRGLDINNGFFNYIKNKYPHKNIELENGFLPDSLNIDEREFDFAICSQVLHTVEDMPLSIENLFNNLRPGGKLIIITFAQSAKDDLVSFFVSIDKIAENYAAGEYILPSGIKVWAEIYFHQEDQTENEILKYGNFEKKYLGPLFVAYECEKNK